MTLVTSLAVLLLLAQADPVARGIAEFNRGDYAAAQRDLQPLASNPRAAVFVALSKAAMGSCDAAVADLQRAFTEKGDRNLRRLAGLALSQCYIAQKRFDDAQPVVLALEKEFPSDADVLYVSANLHMKAWNDAIYRMYQKAPASYRVNQLSAEVFETQGKYPEAIAEYQKAIVKNPKAINLHYRLGRAILLQSANKPAELEQARKQFEAELALNPSDAAAEYQMGQILVLEQKRRDAAPHFDRAVELRPDFPEALVAAGKARVDEKRYAEAVKLFERAVKLQPRSETAHYQLMMAYRNAGLMADAEREKVEIERLQHPPEGEFTDFLKRLGVNPGSETGSKKQP
jgi:tetratricopeptide (TPR) repeat protein